MATSKRGTSRSSKPFVESHAEAYHSDLRVRFSDGNLNPTEHSYRPSLQNFLEDFLEGHQATNEPQRIACGAPDFIITKANVPVGYIECKDLEKDLDAEMESDQITRYLGSLDNLILTNYVEFRWYVRGKHRQTVRLNRVKGKNEKFEAQSGNELEALIQNFASENLPGIKNAEALAERLANCAKTIKNLILRSYEIESENGYLHKWLRSFQAAVIPGLQVDRFADMFAQTLVYGYFSARVTERDQMFTRESASRILPETNPFLKRLFHEFGGLDVPKTLDWAIDETVSLLARTDIETVMMDFGAKDGKNDPIFHFYETFLDKYDPELKDALGAYYTPQPVVDFIVKSTDKILIEKFGCKKGLADKSALILDPSTGTGSFLFHAIEKIRTKMKAVDGTWPQYVSDNLLGRIFGFEIMMAPYAVAHLKISNLLQSTGYTFEPGRRLGVYLTNTLEEAARKSDNLFAEYVSAEANEAAAVKNDNPIVAVIGNPPYKQFAENHGNWIQSLMKDYKAGLKEKKNSGDNDYMKFIRFAQWRIDRTGHGTACFITPNTYLDAVTLRQMRSSLLDSFTDIYVLNLHGSAMVETGGSKGVGDKNVFNIRQGVAITLFVKRKEAIGKCRVYYSEIFGSRESKYKFLSDNDYSTIEWKELEHTKGRNFFAPRSLEKNDSYLSHLSVKEIFPVGTSGIQPKKKEIAIQFTEERMQEVIDELATLTPEKFREKHTAAKDSKGWRLEWAQKHAKELLRKKHGPTRIQYRTFDYRWTVIDDKSGGIVGRPRYDVMQHFKRNANLGLIVLRQLSQASFQHAWVSRSAIDENTISRKTKEYNYVFPLYLVSDELQLTTDHQRVNISRGARDRVREVMGLEITDGIEGDFRKRISPEQFFFYVYAILHSPRYRKTFFEELRIDFPRIPFLRDLEAVKQLSGVGEKLARLHLLEGEMPSQSKIEFKGSGKNTVSALRFDPEEGRLYINKIQYFSDVHLGEWTLKIGGHEVLREFFTDRLGTNLSSDDVDSIRLIIHALKLTPDLMQSVDEVLEKAKFWNAELTIEKPRATAKRSKQA